MKRLFICTVTAAMASIPFLANSAQTCRSAEEVPATAPSSRFEDLSDGSLRDTLTGLMWAKCMAGMNGSKCTEGTVIGNYTWQQALDYAAGSALAGHEDWRLPNIKELHSIVEVQCNSPAINLDVFENFGTGYVWSASPSAQDSSRAWQVDMRNGNTLHGPRDSTSATRILIVRDTQ